MGSDASKGPVEVPLPAPILPRAGTGSTAADALRTLDELEEALVGGAGARQINDGFEKLIEILPIACPAGFRGVTFTMIKGHEAAQGISRSHELFENLKQDALRLIRSLRTSLRSKESDFRSMIQKDDKYAESLNCLQWNICGANAQFTSATGFPLYLLFQSPDVILLQEIKANEKLMEKLTGGLGYDLVTAPSQRPNNRSMRGSAILIRPSKKYSYAVHLFEQDDSGEVEAVFIDVQLIKTKKSFRFVSIYCLNDSTTNFNKAKDLLKKITPKHQMIVAGDLNMPKGKYRSLWEKEGWSDCLKPGWTTNVQGRSSSEIDYVMTAPSGRGNVLCHRPLALEGTNYHLPIPFEVGKPGTGGPCSAEWCSFACDFRSRLQYKMREDL